MRELSKISIHSFIQEFQLKTESGRPIDFSDHAFLFDPIRRLAKLEQDVVILKAAQIGFSTAAIITTLWIAKNRGIDIIYTLPTSDDVRQFAGGKINRIIAQNPIFTDWVKEKDTVEQKAVGDNIVYYRGTWTQKAAMMVSSDLNVYDEVDASNQNVIQQYSTRLQHSSLRRQWYFSHPSVPGNGVDKHWGNSTQHHWFVKCDACKKWQYLSWPDSIDPERKIYQCTECRVEITDNQRRLGQWVAKYKDKPMLGYWIPLLICPWVSAKDILAYKNTKTEDYFVNKVLGLPYVGSGNKVTQQQIYQNLTAELNMQEGRIVIGVDTGIDIRYVCGNRQGLFYYGECKDYDELERLMIRFPRAIMVIDQGGDIIGSRKLREKFPGRVFLCHYAVDRKTMQLIRWGEHDESGNVIADRNRMIQLVIDEFTDKRIKLHYLENKDDWYDYWLHWSHTYRVGEEDQLGVVRYKWERSDRDDWVHATVYWRVGMDRFGTKGAILRNIQQAEPNSYQVTPEGKGDALPPAIQKAMKRVYEPPEMVDWRN